MNKTKRPEELTWTPCLCGHPLCKRKQIANLGMFYQGSGFEPHEADWLDQAWRLATLTEKARTHEQT